MQFSIYGIARGAGHRRAGEEVLQTGPDTHVVDSSLFRSCSAAFLGCLDVIVPSCSQIKLPAQESDSTRSEKFAIHLRPTRWLSRSNTGGHGSI